MKKTLILLLLAPFALNAMDTTKKLRPVKVYIIPTPAHARADKNQETVFSASSAPNPYTVKGIFRANQQIGATARGTEVEILETIPNNETESLAVLYSFKKSHDTKPSLGIVNAKYGTRATPLGDKTNGVQYFLHILNPFISSLINIKRPPVKSEDLSDDARAFLALFGRTPANTNNNNNQ